MPGARGARAYGGGSLSAPESRLVGDAAAQSFEIDARALLACSPFTTPAVEARAAAVVLLLEDRQARIEMEARG